MTNIMIDLETLGTRPGSTILSIGATTFDTSGVGEDEFYWVINRKTCAAAGLKEFDDTVFWWARQPGGVAFLSKCNDDRSAPLGGVLSIFTTWLDNLEPIGTRFIWGNGADFDIALLAEAYHRCGLIPPWKYSNVRCYRTLKNLHPACPIAVANNHNALDDAKNQAEHASRLLTFYADV